MKAPIFRQVAIFCKNRNRIETKCKLFAIFRRKGVEKMKRLMRYKCVIENYFPMQNPALKSSMRRSPRRRNPRR